LKLFRRPTAREIPMVELDRGLDQVGELLADVDATCERIPSRTHDSDLGHARIMGREGPER